jgi:hypothetical protein
LAVVPRRDGHVIGCCLSVSVIGYYDGVKVVGWSAVVIGTISRKTAVIGCQLLCNLRSSVDLYLLLYKNEKKNIIYFVTSCNSLFIFKFKVTYFAQDFRVNPTV